MYSDQSSNQSSNQSGRSAGKPKRGYEESGSEDGSENGDAAFGGGAQPISFAWGGLGAIPEKNSRRKFTLGANVCIANALRRAILSDVPVVVMRTSPHENDDCTITKNNTRFTNELVKQQISGVPVHVRADDAEFLSDAELVLSVDGDRVSTEDFRLRDRHTGEFAPDSVTRAVFPKNEHGFFVDLMTEANTKLDLTCGFSVGTAGENGMFVAANECGMRATPDTERIRVAEAEKRAEIANRSPPLTEAAAKTEMVDWGHLQAPRITRPNSFEFTVRTVCALTPEEIVLAAQNAVVRRLEQTAASLEGETDAGRNRDSNDGHDGHDGNDSNDGHNNKRESPDGENDATIRTPAMHGFRADCANSVEKHRAGTDRAAASAWVSAAQTTIKNARDIHIVGGGDSIGRILRAYMDLHGGVVDSNQANPSDHTNQSDLTYCGFIKPHPHIDRCVVRVGFSSESGAHTAAARAAAVLRRAADDMRATVDAALRAPV
jgi:DNA-directed RNA polymerase subunit L